MPDPLPQSVKASASRLDLLLALGRVFEEEQSALSETGNADQNPFACFSLLLLEEQQAMQQRADWYMTLPEEEKQRWLLGTLKQARPHWREELLRLDEHVDPSQIVAVLQAEPVRLQRLVLQHLPQHLAEHAAQALGFGSTWRLSDEAKQAAPEPGILAVIRRTFLSHFVAAGELQQRTALDRLSGAQLLFLLRQRGIHEVALACRSLPALETLSAFLRRFADAHASAIVRTMGEMASITPERAAFAAQFVAEIFGSDPEATALLDRVGLELLAIALLHSEPRRLRYLGQKLPRATEDELRQAVEKYRTHPMAEQAYQTIRETEAMAQRCFSSLEMK